MEADRLAKPHGGANNLLSRLSGSQGCVVRPPSEHVPPRLPCHGVAGGISLVSAHKQQVAEFIDGIAILASARLSSFG
jgi:hypothetical protein